MFTNQRRALERQHSTGIGNWRKGAVINAPQAEIVIKSAGLTHDVGIGCGISTNDHLRGLASGCKARRVPETLLRILRFDKVRLHPAHRPFNLLRVLIRRKTDQPAVGWQFDIDRNTVGIKTCLMNDLGIGLGNSFQMNIPAKIMLFTQDTGDFDDLLHRMVRILHDAGREKQPLDIIAAVKSEREVDHFLRREARPYDVRTLPVDAVMAIEHAVIGQQYL